MPSKKNMPLRRTKSVIRHSSSAAEVQQGDSAEHLQAPISNITDQAGVHGMLEKMHPNFVGNLAYISLCEAMGISGEFLEAAIPSSLNFQEQMRPLDPLEGLALTQALVAHANAMWLAKLAAAQTNPHSLCAISEASGRASNTFARLMTAIQKYRRPAPSSTTVSIAQANVAGQQVVQNILKHEDRNDDQTSIGQSGPATKTAELPPNTERLALSAINNQTDAAVDEEHWPADDYRKGSRKPQCVKARRAVGSENRTQKNDEPNH
jgi:hypothetical protein